MAASTQAKDLGTPPWSMDALSPLAGWQVPSEVKASGIPQCGKGRFVLKDVAKGTAIRITKVVRGPANQYGTTCVSASADELAAHFDFADCPDMPSNQDQIVHFGGTPVGMTNANQDVYHWVPCNFFNTHEDFNVEPRLIKEKNEIHIVALKDIKAGEEIFQDYRVFKMPEWFQAWCKDQCGLEDATTLAKNIYGALDSEGSTPNKRAADFDTIAVEPMTKRPAEKAGLELREYSTPVDHWHPQTFDWDGPGKDISLSKSRGSLGPVARRKEMDKGAKQLGTPLDLSF